MPTFGKRSLVERDTLHEDLKLILDEAIKYVDFMIVQGYRDEETQNKYFVEKKSNLRYPNSLHNKIPSMAVDIVPFVNDVGLDWDNTDRFYKVVFFIKGIAYAKGIEVRLGADWDGDFYSKDQKFHDIPHIELYKKLVDDKWILYKDLK